MTAPIRSMPELEHGQMHVIVARSMPELVAALRAWRDERGITHEVFDAIAGWSAGYSSKLFAPKPIKNLGWMSLEDALKTLAIQIVVVEDKEQRKLVEGRWKQRERPNHMPAPASFAASNEDKKIDTPSQKPPLVSHAHLRVVQGKRRGSKYG